MNSRTHWKSFNVYMATNKTLNKNIKFASKNTLAGTRKKPRAPYVNVMFKRAQLTRFCILISSFLLASCAFQGDGAYKKDTSWLIFMPATYHHVKFDSFDMSEESQEYEFKNMNSRIYVQAMLDSNFRSIGILRS